MRKITGLVIRTLKGGSFDMPNPGNPCVWIIEPDLVVNQDLSEIFLSLLPEFDQMSFHKPEDIPVSEPLPHLAAIRCGSHARGDEMLIQRLSAAGLPIILIESGKNTFEQPSIYAISVPFSDADIRAVLNQIGFETPLPPLRPFQP